MYDAIDDPYTYENSTVLVNKLDLREQAFMFKGGNPFCFPENIENQAAKLFGELQADSFLQGLDESTFADSAAHFLAELNVIHAFREGNGRSQLTLPYWLTMPATRLISTSSTRIKCLLP